jgi:tetratricopeptide (TPR) repeat protein
MAEETNKTGGGVAKTPAKVPATTSTTAARSAKRRREEEDSNAYTGTAFSMAGIRGLLQKSILWKAVMALLIFIFAVGFAITAITPGGSGGPGGGGTGGPSRVATIGDQVVEREDYINASRGQIQQMEQFGMKTGTLELLGSYQRSLDNLVSDAAQYDAAIAQGMTPTDAEIEADIEKKVKEALKMEGDGAAAQRRQIEAQFGSLAEYETKVRENLEEQREKLARQLAIDKLKKSIEDKSKTTEADYKRSVTKLDLYQITVRPKPEPVLPGKDAAVAQDKSKADAKAKAEKLAQTLKNADLAAFKAAAKKESDDFSTKEKGGSLGWMLPSQVGVAQPAKDAILAATGKIVGPIEDEWSGGWVIFYINGRKEELPKDYAKNKKQLLKDFETQKDTEAWTKYIEDLKKAKPAEILDPAMAAYKIQNEKLFSAPPDQQKTLRQEALDKYQEALAYSTPEEAAAIHYQMAQLHRQAGDNAKVVASLQSAVKQGSDPNLRVQLATALHEAKRTKEALEELKKASQELDKNPSQASPFGGASPDGGVRMQIASAYDMMNKKDLAAAERKKIPPPPAGGAGGMGGLSGLGGMGGAPITINPSR